MRSVEMNITIGYLQEYIRTNDYRPDLKEKYYMKLAEEVGELSEPCEKIIARKTRAI